MINRSIFFSLECALASALLAAGCGGPIPTEPDSADRAQKSAVPTGIGSPVESSQVARNDSTASTDVTSTSGGLQISPFGTDELQSDLIPATDDERTSDSTPPSEWRAAKEAAKRVAANKPALDSAEESDGEPAASDDNPPAAEAEPANAGPPANSAGTSANVSNKRVVAEPSPKADTKAAPNKPAAPAARPQFESWPKPKAAFLISGQQHGFFEPCGCTEMQSGGMARRGDLVRRAEAMGWAVVGLDVGGNARRTRRQSQIKYEMLLAAYKDLHYLGIAVGPEELRLGADFFLQQLNPDDTSANVPLMSSNVVLFESPDIGTPKSVRVIDINGVKVGVTAITGPKFNGAAIIDENSNDIRIDDPLAALPKALEQIDAQKPDLRVLLAHIDLEDARKLVEKFPQFDIVLAAGGPEDPLGQPVKVGNTWLLETGHKGKSVGVLGYFPDTPERFRYEYVELDQARFKEDRRMIEHMRNYQQRLIDEAIAGNHPDNAPVKHASGSTYVGAEKCGECHTKAYAKWQTTPHANAFESLKHAREGAVEYGISRAFDAECLSCHVTGWHPQEVFRYETGFINEEFAANAQEKDMARLLKGNQCENCHGPGSKHVELTSTGDESKYPEARKLMKVTLEAAKKHLCFECHDVENSPHFKFETSWPEIEHKGLD